MDPQLLKLVSDVAQSTGATPPDLLADDAPVPDTQPAPFYFIGVIGGKDIGKSALINAIVQSPITTEIGFGQGTREVVAYVHQSHENAVRELLQREAPDQFTIVAHQLPHLVSQVLLDLPDIDSHWESHVKLTTRMLRFMLYPIWMQSIEKYADRQVQDLLRKVALGNSPGNFLFCLNKVDQLGSNQQAIDELRTDFAQRVANVLQLDAAPAVYAISATHPDRYDLPKLRAVLSRQKEAKQVESDRRDAARQQANTLLNWLREQKLDEQRDRLARLEQQADESLRQRILAAVDSQVTLSQPIDRLDIIDHAMSRRVRRWIPVNVLHATIWPVLTLIRVNTRPASITTDTVALTESLGASLQAGFAQLHQAHPELSAIYAHRRPWETLSSQAAAGRLIGQLQQSADQRRGQIVERAGKGTPLLAPVRLLITIGVPLWLLFAQPLLVAWQSGAIDLLKVLVFHLNVAFLLTNAVFFVFWMIALWITLRWYTQARVTRLLSKADADSESPEVIVEWIDELLAPIHDRRQHFEQLTQRIDRATRAGKR